MQSFSRFAFIAVIGSFAFGCGGDDSSGIPSGGNDASGFEVGAGDDAAGGVDATGGDDASMGDDSGGGMDAARDTAPMGDPGVLCGKNAQMQNVYCTNVTQICCFGQQGDAGAACQPANQACGTGEANIHCDDTADCINGVCCGTLQANQYTDIVCRTQCQGGQIRFCDPSVPSDGGVIDAGMIDGGPPPRSDCPAQMACQPSTVLPGFHVCR
jgi:hypothetical protein